MKPTWRRGKAYCGACGRRIPLKIKARFCHKCGQWIEWTSRNITQEDYENEGGWPVPRAKE